MLEPSRWSSKTTFIQRTFGGKFWTAMWHCLIGSHVTFSTGPPGCIFSNLPSHQTQSPATSSHLPSEHLPRQHSVYTVPHQQSIHTCHVSSPGAATCHASVDILHVCLKLQNIITSTYGVRLSPFKRRRKALVEFFAMVSSSSAVKNIKFSVTKSTWINNAGAGWR